MKFRVKAERKAYKKRSVNGQPVVTYVEVLVVADFSVLQKFQKLLAITDVNLCFLYMKIYYAHLVSAVSAQ